MYPIGGAATMKIQKSPKEEIVVALAGPMVNVAFLPVLWIFATIHPILAYVSLANLGLLFFNLLPVFPMDGGRVLRAALTWWLGDRLRATRYSVYISSVFCGLFCIVGILTLNLVVVIVGVLVFLAAKRELNNLKGMKEAEDYVRQFMSESPDADVEESAKMLRDTQSRLQRLNAKSRVY
jgi:stage IV sporulation protein FB